MTAPLPSLCRPLLLAALAALATGCATRGRRDPGPTAIARTSAAAAPAAAKTRLSSAAHEQLGGQYASAGRQDLAVATLRLAALLCFDPVRRGRIHRKLTQTASAVELPQALRRAAVADLDLGALARAEQRLHSARRAAPEPALDYRLLHELHVCRDDRAAAFAAEVLAREHDYAASAAAARPHIEIARASARRPAATRGVTGRTPRPPQR